MKKISNNKIVNKIVEMWKENPLFSTSIALLVMIILQTFSLGFNYGSFIEWLNAWVNNWLNILRNNANIGIIALGMTFVIISGGIELAVGSTLVAVSAIMMVVLDVGPNGFLKNMGIEGFPVIVLAILVALVVGSLFGTGTGLLITKGNIPPFIATLGTMKILRSVTQHFMQTYSPLVPNSFLNIANFKILDRYLLPIIYWAIAAYILHWVSKNTLFGRRVFAIGSNERAAKLSGVNVQRTRTLVYTLMGFLVAIASIIQVSRIGSMDFSNAGSGYEMDAIAAVIVGGTSMSGGKGSIAGTVLGTLIIAVMNNLLNLIGVPPFLREAFKGFIVVVAVFLQRKEKTS